MTNQISDTAAALASALPADVLYRGRERANIGYVPGEWLTAEQVAAFQAGRLAEQGWVLVRPDDEATVERVARAMCERAFYEPDNPPCSSHRADARAALAALAARPGGADTEHAEVG